jgi:hypothetical protein
MVFVRNITCRTSGPEGLDRDTSGLFLVQRLASEGGVADGTERNRVAWIR